MRILVLCYEYPPIGGGGGRVAQTVAEALVARGHEVRVQTAALGWKSVRETIGGVEVFRTASGRRAPDTCRVHEMGAYCATSFWPALQHAWNWSPDVIHAHFAMPTGMLAWAVRRLSRVPYVLTAHLGDVPGGVPEQTDKLFRFIGPFAHRVWHEAAAATAVSSFVRKLAVDAYHRPVHCVLNGVDMTGAPPPAAPKDIRELVFVGRFNEQKSPTFLPPVLRKCRLKNWRLTAIGDGPLMPAFRRSVLASGIEDHVKVRGWLDAAEVQRILRSSDVLLMPSQSEGLPVAGIEALKCGLAILASDIPGVQDVVENGRNGFLLPVLHEDPWTWKIDWLLDRPDVLAAMKRASWEKAREFDLDRIIGQYETVLQQAAK